MIEFSASFSRGANLVPRLIHGFKPALFVTAELFIYTVSTIWEQRVLLGFSALRYFFNFSYFNKGSHVQFFNVFNQANTFRERIGSSLLDLPHFATFLGKKSKTVLPIYYVFSKRAFSEPEMLFLGILGPLDLWDFSLKSLSILKLALFEF